MRIGDSPMGELNSNLGTSNTSANLPEDLNGRSTRRAPRVDDKPFSGMIICCSGVKDKHVLFAKARDMGAQCADDLTDLTTHLVANAPGSEKHRVACELGLPICTSAWIVETHKRWLAGEDIDPEEAVTEHLLRPLRGIVICITRLADSGTCRRLSKSATRLGAKYQSHIDRAMTHLLISPGNDGRADSEELQSVDRINAERSEKQSKKPPIHVVWDVWLMACADKNSYVPEVEFQYSGPGSRPEIPNELIALLKQPPLENTARTYIPVSNFHTGTGLEAATLFDYDTPPSSIRGPARISSNATLAPEPRSSSALNLNGAESSFVAKVFDGKRVALIGEARNPKLYVALYAHGAIVVDHLDYSDSEGKNEWVESEKSVALPPGEVDYYIVRLASESAKQAVALDSYPKFRTDCWVERCIFEDRICPCEENVTYAPLKIQLPVPGAGSIVLHWTGIYKEQETVVKRLADAIGITTTELFAKGTNTHLLCPLRSGIKYEKALQWGIVVVDMDWLYKIANEGRIPDTNIAHVGLELGRPTSCVDTADMSRLGGTSGICGVGCTSVFVTTDSSLALLDSSTHKELVQMRIDSNKSRGPRSNSAESNSLRELTNQTSVPSLDTQPRDTISNIASCSGVASDRVTEPEAQGGQVPDSLATSSKKHQREESVHSDQARKRNRPVINHEFGDGAAASGGAGSDSLTEGVSSLSISTPPSEPDSVWPFEETLQVQEHGPR